MVCRTLWALVLVVLTGCADDVVRESSVPRADKATVSQAVAATSTGGSSVCAAYRRRLSIVRIRLRAPGLSAAVSETLRQRETALEALIADACE